MSERSEPVFGLKLGDFPPDEAGRLLRSTAAQICDVLSAPLPDQRETTLRNRLASVRLIKQTLEGIARKTGYPATEVRILVRILWLSLDTHDRLLSERIFWANDPESAEARQGSKEFQDYVEAGRK